MSETDLARCRRPDVTHHAGCACHEARWEARLSAMVSIADGMKLERDEMREVIRAATVLIAAKGRHNTFLAYQALKKLIEP